jgi:hypothetical protein
MGTNAQIPLMVNTPQPESPLKTIGGLMQLRSAMTENALRAAQTQQAQSQAADLASQAAVRQQQFKDAQTAQQIMGDPANAKAIFGGDTSPLNGKVSPLYLADLNSKITTAATSRAELRGKEIANDQAANDKIQKTFEGLQALPPDARVEAWPTAIAQLRSDGYLKHIQMDLPALSTGSDDEMKGIEAKLGMLQGITDHAATIQKTQAETEASKQTALSSGATAEKTKTETQLSQIKLQRMKDIQAHPELLDQQIDGEIDPQKYPDENKRVKIAAHSATDYDATQAAIAKGSENVANMERSIAVAKNTVPYRIAIEQAKQDPYAESVHPALESGATGEAFLAKLPPTIQKTVKAIADGREDPITGFALTRGGGMTIMNAVNTYDPTWSVQRAQVRKAFTTGTDGRNIGNLNTAVVHLDQLGEIAKAMDNGTFKPGNEVWNRAVTMFGGTPPTNYEGLRQALAGEMDQGLHGTSTIPGREAILETMPKSASPGQMGGIVDTNAKTLATKLGTYDQRYHQQAPDDKTWSPVLPQAQAVLQKYGVTVGASGMAVGGTGGTSGKIIVTAPDGSTHPFDTQAQADKFKKLAGIQ